MEGSIAWGEGTSQLGLVSLEGWGWVWGFWMQEEVDQKRNGRLGLPNKTQVDMGIREGGFIQT